MLRFLADGGRLWLQRLQVNSALDLVQTTVKQLMVQLSCLLRLIHQLAHIPQHKIPGSSSIRYTIDEVTPSCGPATGVPYIVPIPVSVGLTIKAISCYPDGYSSEVSTFVYIINPASNGGGVSGGNGGGGGGGNVAVVTSIKGDTNNDKRVDILDFVALMANWGSSKSGNLADFNGDNKVDILDFVTLMANWTK